MIMNRKPDICNGRTNDRSPSESTNFREKWGNSQNIEVRGFR